MRSKYGNVPTVVDGHRFPSRGEAKRYCELKLLERAGEISGLKKQVPFECRVNGVKVCTYFADFVYQENGRQVVEDFKGHRTKVFKLKKRLVLACHGITIKETGARR